MGGRRGRGRVERLRRAQHGDIVTDWLLQLVLILGVVAVLGYEVIAIVVTNVGLDDTAREVARATRAEYGATGSLERATATATQVAEAHEVEVVAVLEEDDGLAVTLAKRPPTIFVHRVAALDDLTTATATGRVAGPP